MSLSTKIENRLGGRLLQVHNAIYRRSHGWIGHRLPIPGLAPILLLHTVGAKTGRPRTTSLSYARDGDSYLVVASKGGDPRSPGWYHNLKADPNAEINVGPRRRAVTATPVLPDNPDYDRLWALVNANNGDRYAAYQRRTSRPIPVVVLTPR